MIKHMINLYPEKNVYAETSVESDNVLYFLGHPSNIILAFFLGNQLF